MLIWGTANYLLLEDNKLVNKDEELEKLQEKLVREEQEREAKKPMPVVGRSVFQIKQILESKKKHREK